MNIFQRCIKDIETVSARYIFEPLDKATQAKATKEVNLIVSYYKLMCAEFESESVSIKLNAGTEGVQLTFSPKLHEWYIKPSS